MSGNERRKTGETNVSDPSKFKSKILYCIRKSEKAFGVTNLVSSLYIYLLCRVSIRGQKFTHSGCVSTLFLNLSRLLFDVSYKTEIFLLYLIPQVCSKFFPSLSSLKKHCDKSHKNKSSNLAIFFCCYCQEVFDSHEQIRMHKLEEHPGNRI